MHRAFFALAFKSCDPVSFIPQFIGHTMAVLPVDDADANAAKRKFFLQFDSHHIAGRKS
jgi:hypothetical protein